MRIQFTSIVWEDVGLTVNAALLRLEDGVNEIIGFRDYGGDVQSFMVALIAVDDEQNSRFAKQYNRVGFVKDTFDERFRQICISVEMLPSELEGKDVRQVSNLFVSATKARLELPGVKLPSRFDWIEFRDDFRRALGSVET
jgi:hypothetical protein